MEIRPILPKRKIINAQRVHRGLTQEMHGFVTRLAQKFKPYPGQRPTVSGYIRTGTLKRSYHHKVESRPGLIVGQVGSDPATFLRAYYWRRSPYTGRRLGPYRVKKPYARYVMGKEQSKEMAGRGWKKVGDILKKEWPGQVKKFQRVINRAK